MWPGVTPSWWLDTTLALTEFVDQRDICHRTSRARIGDSRVARRENTAVRHSDAGEMVQLAGVTVRDMVRSAAIRDAKMATTKIVTNARTYCGGYVFS